MFENFNVPFRTPRQREETSPLKKEDYVKVQRFHPVRPGWIGQVVIEEDEEGSLVIRFPDGLDVAYERADLIKQYNMKGLIAVPREEILIHLFRYAEGKRYLCIDMLEKDGREMLVGYEDPATKIEVPLEEIQPILFSANQKLYCGYAQILKEGKMLVCGYETDKNLWDHTLEKIKKIRNGETVDD